MATICRVRRAALRGDGERRARNDMASRPNDRGNAALHDRWVAGACLSLAIVCFGAAFWWHPVPSDTSAENDRYLLHATRLLAGEWPRDVFRPQLYAVLSALASLPFGDVFTGARLVSSLAFGAALYCIYRIGCAIGSCAVGVAAMVTLLGSPSFAQFGMLAQSDMLFLALVLASIVCVVSRREGHTSWRASLLAGAFAGLAFATRYQAAVPIVVIALGVLCGARTDGAQRVGVTARWREFAGFSAVAAIVCIPQLVLNWRTFGSPLYEEGWRNLAFKLDGGDDWSLMWRDIEPAGWRGVATGRWAEIWHGWWHELAKAWFESVPWAFGGGAIGLAFCSLAVIGMLGAVWRARVDPHARQVVWMGGIGFAHVLVTCVVFYGTLRQCLLAIVLVAPCAYLGALCLLPRAMPARWRWTVPIGAALAVLGVAWSTTAPRVVGQFAASHSVGVHRLAASLGNAGDRPRRVVGSHSDLASFYDFEYRNDASIGGIYDLGGVDDHYFEFLRWELSQRPADFAIFGRGRPGRRPEALWRGEVKLDFLELVRREDDAALYRVRVDRAPAVASPR